MGTGHQLQFLWVGTGDQLQFLWVGTGDQLQFLWEWELVRPVVIDPEKRGNWSQLPRSCQIWTGQSQFASTSRHFLSLNWVNSLASVVHYYMLNNQNISTTEIIIFIQMTWVPFAPTCHIPWTVLVFRSHNWTLKADSAGTVEVNWFACLWTVASYVLDQEHCDVHIPRSHVRYVI